MNIYLDRGLVLVMSVVVVAGVAGRGEQARFLRDELNTMESQNAQLNRDLKEKDKSFKEEKESSERVRRSHLWLQLK